MMFCLKEFYRFSVLLEGNVIKFLNRHHAFRVFGLQQQH